MRKLHKKKNDSCKTKTISFIDMDTGEFYGSKQLGEGDSLKTQVVTSEQKKFAKAKKDEEEDTILFTGSTEFGKLFYKMMPYIRKEINGSDWLFFCSLCEHMSYEDCLLRLNGDKRHHPFSKIQEIADALDMSYDTCKRRMHTLYMHQMIITLNTNQVTNYMINPYIIFRGKNLKKSIVEGFQKTRWSKYNDEILEKIKEEG